MVDVELMLKNSGGLHKFEGIAPEGFVLVHEKSLEDLKSFNNWILWKIKKNYLKELDKKNFKTI